MGVPSFLPVLASSSGAAVEQLVEQAVRGSANKLLFDVLYQLQKDAGKVPVDCHGSARRVPSAWCTTHAGNAPCIYHAPRPDSRCSSSRRSALSPRRLAGSR